MGMEPFDYLTYKKNKISKMKNGIEKKDKVIAVLICVFTFLVFFFMVLHVISSRGSKIDIEYGRLGTKTPTANLEADKPVYNFEETEEQPKKEKYTIDKRLFLIQQEEKGPSESKVIEHSKEQTEVISKKEFEMIKTNNEVVKTNFEKLAAKEETKVEENKKEEIIVPTPSQNNTNTIQKEAQKIAMKPKLPIQPAVKPISAIEAQNVSSKVLIGKYTTLEDARKAISKLNNLPDGVIPFVKKVNSYYSIQMGSYENFEIAKTIAAKYKEQGYNVWILQ